MTPKEKAKELVDRFTCIDDCYEHYSNKPSPCIHIAKDCAIICVDEIFKYMGEIDDETTMSEKQPNGLPYTCWHYWVTVKQEIEAL